MKATVIKPFTDRTTGKSCKAGALLEFSEARAKELEKLGYVAISQEGEKPKKKKKAKAEAEEMEALADAADDEDAEA